MISGEKENRSNNNKYQKHCDYVHKGDLNWLFSDLAWILWETKWERIKKSVKVEWERNERKSGGDGGDTSNSNITKTNGTTLSRLLKVILHSHTIHGKICEKWRMRKGRSSKNMRYKLVPSLLSNIYRNISAAFRANAFIKNNKMHCIFRMGKMFLFFSKVFLMCAVSCKCMWMRIGVFVCVCVCAWACGCGVE